jgi:ribosomal protein S18 acetylase RimI-like enzyme
MLDSVAGRVAARGAHRLTLLVAESNEPARALYGRLGFAHKASFVFSSRDRITRASAGTGAASATA